MFRQAYSVILLPINLLKNEKNATLIYDVKFHN